MMFSITKKDFNYIDFILQQYLSFSKGELIQEKRDEDEYEFLEGQIDQLKSIIKSLRSQYHEHGGMFGTESEFSDKTKRGSNPRRHRR